MTPGGFAARARRAGGRAAVAPAGRFNGGRFLLAAGAAGSIGSPTRGAAPVVLVSVRRGAVPSGGLLPVSIAVHGSLV
jgi:hypothetical protein